MKFNISKISLATLALGTTLTGIASAQSEPRLLLNDRPFRTEVAPITQDGRVLVPLRDIFEGLGARVDYKSTDQTITARRRGTIVRMELDSRRAEINGRRVRLDVPATTVDGSTMVPLRFVSEALGATVDYNANRGVIRINDGEAGRRDGDRRDGDRRDDGRKDDGRKDGGRLDDRKNDGRMDDHRSNENR